MTPTERLRAIAYHEAGHATIACVLQRPFLHVSIVPDEENLGHLRKTAPPKSLHPECDSGTRAERWTRREIMISLAGPLAEKLQTGRGNWRIGADEDFHHAFDLACYHTMGGEETNAYVRWLWERTKTLLTLNWAGVEALATALLEQPTVGAKRAHMLFREAMHQGAEHLVLSS